VVARTQQFRTLLAIRQDGQPHCYVGAWLADWLREQEGYVFPEDKEEPEGQNGNHAMDATSYMTYSHSLLWQQGAEYAAADAGRMKKESRSWGGY
jgi:hypothetical protein